MRRVVGRALLGVAGLLWLVGGWVFLLGLRAGVRASNMLGDRQHWSNCVVEAWDAYQTLRDLGQEPYLWGRESRARNGIIHVGVGEHDEKTDQLVMWSFKPTAPVDEPMWRAWKRLRFAGAWRRGDRRPPETEHRG